MGNSLEMFRFIIPTIRHCTIAHAVLAGTNNYARAQVLWLTHLMPHAVDNVKGTGESSLVVGLLPFPSTDKLPKVVILRYLCYFLREIATEWIEHCDSTVASVVPVLSSYVTEMLWLL